MFSLAVYSSATYSSGTSSPVNSSAFVKSYAPKVVGSKNRCVPSCAKKSEPGMNASMRGVAKALSCNVGSSLLNSKAVKSKSRSFVLVRKRAPNFRFPLATGKVKSKRALRSRSKVFWFCSVNSCRPKSSDTDPFPGAVKTMRMGSLFVISSGAPFTRYCM